jgi:aminopeptidase
MADFATKLERYAALAVEVGVNVQPGQTLVITASLDAAPFVRQAVRKAYAAGARMVHVDWIDDEVTRIRYDMAPADSFKEYPMWRARGWEEMAENGAAFLSITSSDPDLLSGVDPQRIADARKAAGAALQNYRNYILSDKVSWSIVAVPSPGWAMKVFPDLDPEKAVEALWDAIFAATRMLEDDPVRAWREHLRRLEERAAILNDRKYRLLRFRGPGTDLTVELPPEHLWVSGGSVNEKGVPFVANMPTEEVFTAPLKDGVNGTVRATKPLSYGGTLIRDFSFTFRDGKIVDIRAEQGLETLKKLIATDEGSASLGEVALVPHGSPISRTNLVFYNTLFDENASCHLAIGAGYAFCLEGGKDKSRDELANLGLNNSIVHVDFMIGSAETDIDGVRPDGTVDALFRGGEWAF